MTVAPANESDGLRQLLGKGGQLGGAMGEILDRSELLGGRGGDRFGFLRGGVRAAASPLQRLGDFRREPGAVAADLGDLLAGARRLQRRVGDAVEVLYPRGGVLDDLAGRRGSAR